AAFADGDAELGAAAEHAARAGVEHATVSASPDWTAALDRLLAAHGGPVGGPEVAALWLAATRARGEVDVLLAGVGGEEIFGGSPPARVVERVRRYRALPALAREGAQFWVRLAPPGPAARLRRPAAARRPPHRAVRRERAGGAAWRRGRAPAPPARRSGRAPPPRDAPCRAREPGAAAARLVGLARRGAHPRTHRRSRLLPPRDGRTPFEGAPQRRAGSHVAPVVDRARHTLARASGAACARRRARRGLARAG